VLSSLLQVGDGFRLPHAAGAQSGFCSAYSLLSSLELSDTKVYEPLIRALLGIVSKFSVSFEGEWLAAGG